MLICFCVNAIFHYNSSAILLTSSEKTSWRLLRITFIFLISFFLPNKHFLKASNDIVLSTTDFLIPLHFLVSLVKDAVIHQFEEILLKLIGCFCSQLSVQVDVLLQPSAVFEFDTTLVLGNS